MAIKRLKFYNLNLSSSNSVGLANLNFYNKDDNRVLLNISEDIDLINMTHNSDYTYFELPGKFTCTLNYPAWRVSDPLFLIQDTPTIDPNISSSTESGRRILISAKGGSSSPNFSIEYVFTDPIEAAYFCWSTYFAKAARIDSPYSLEVKDENDEIVFAKDNINPSKAPNDLSYCYLETEEKKYITGSPQKVITTATSNISNISLINAIRIKQNEPVNTKIRYLLSFGGREYVKFDSVNKKWVNTQITSAQDIIDKGSTKEELEDLLSIDFYETNGHNKDESIDVACAMISNDETKTPKIQQFRILGYIE